MKHAQRDLAPGHNIGNKMQLRMNVANLISVHCEAPWACSRPKLGKRFLFAHVFWPIKYANAICEISFLFIVRIEASLILINVIRNKCINWEYCRKCRFRCFYIDFITFTLDDLVLLPGTLLCSHKICAFVTMCNKKLKFCTELKLHL